MGHRDMNPPVRRVVRDSEYPWGNTTMMNLYSGTTDPFSHRCRIVLFEKGMDFQVIDVDLFNKPEDIAVINPYNRVPVLVDRDLVGFLTYMGEPMATFRKELGVIVLIFLAVLFVFTYALKREYWKDIH